MTTITTCPRGKILNPLTGRCVDINGKVGKAIVAAARPLPAAAAAVARPPPSQYPDPTPLDQFRTAGAGDADLISLYQAMKDFDNLKPAMSGELIEPKAISKIIPFVREKTEFYFDPPFLVTFPLFTDIFPPWKINHKAKSQLLNAFSKFPFLDTLYELNDVTVSATRIIIATATHKYNAENGYYSVSPRDPKIFTNSFEDILELYQANRKLLYKLSNLIAFLVYIVEINRGFLPVNYIKNLAIYISQIETSEEVVNVETIVNNLNDGKGGTDFGKIVLSKYTNDPNSMAINENLKFTEAASEGWKEFYDWLDVYDKTVKPVFTRLASNEEIMDSQSSHIYMAINVFMDKIKQFGDTD